MKKSLLNSAIFALSSVFVASAFAQTAAAPAAAAPAAKPVPAVVTPAAPATAGTASVHAICKDGTSFNGEKMNGACSGHGGVDKKATKAAKAGTAPAKTAAPTAAKSTPAAAPMAQAPGGGAGKVWGNDNTKVYHCQNDKFYGKTKHGEYMTEADAKTKGFHAAAGKACAQ